MRFDAALLSYTRLYELTYRDPQWMIKVAEMRARSGQNPEAVAALKSAIIGARAETVNADFSIAERLEGWHILADAVTFAERGAKLEGLGFWEDSGNALIYAHVMSTARRMDLVLGTNQPALLQAAGRIVQDLYTPAEKAGLEHTLESHAARMKVLLPLLEAGGLVDLEARWRMQAMNAEHTIDPRFVTLQSQRGLYAELDRQMEEFAAKNAEPSVVAGALLQAAQSFRAEGDPESEIRVLRKALLQNGLGGESLDRYLALLIARQPQELVSLAGSRVPDNIRNRAIQLAIAGDRQDLAYAAIRARGSALPPLWTRAYTGLTGNYFSDHSAPVDASFRAALDTRTIGERLKIPPLTQAMIAGSVWFYFGSRYGEFLGEGHQPEAEAWLPASLEAAPLSAGAYVALGDWYGGAQAIHEFQLALELDPDRADAHDHSARVWWSEGRKPQAISEWKSAVATFLRVQGQGVRVPEWFWSRAAETFTDIGQSHALGELRGDISHLLRDYYQRNNAYRLNELIEPAARASLASGEGTTWLVELARSMENPEMILNALMQSPGINAAQKVALQRDIVTVRAKQVAASFGDNRTYAGAALAQARWQLSSMLLDAGDANGAAEMWRQIPADLARTLDLSLEIRLAAGNGTLPKLLEEYGTATGVYVPSEILQRAAVALRKKGDENSARSVLEFLYEREIRAGRLAAANFLGLAEVKLQRNETPAAIALLNRMALVLEDGFETLTPAAGLLEKYGKKAEAQDFLRRRIKAVPWDSAAKVQLARLLPDSSPEREQLLTVAASDMQAAYPVRAEAGRITPEAVAATDPVERLRLWRKALAMAPGDPQARSGALRAALAMKQDSLALALSSGLPSPELSDLEALAGAAERLNDLPTAQRYLRAVIDLEPPDRDALVHHVKALAAEQDRRAKNDARQPLIKNVIEQERIVRPRIARSAP